MRRCNIYREHDFESVRTLGPIIENSVEFLSGRPTLYFSTSLLDSTLPSSFFSPPPIEPITRDRKYF